MNDFGYYRLPKTHHTRYGTPEMALVWLRGILPDDVADYLPLYHKLWVEVTKVVYNWVHKLQMHTTQLS